MLQVGYIGNKQVHGTLSNAISSTPLLPFLSRSPLRDQATINALGALVANPFAGLLPGSSINGSTISVATLLQAFPAIHRRHAEQQQSGMGHVQRAHRDVPEALRQGTAVHRELPAFAPVGFGYQNNAGDNTLSYGPTSGDFPDHFVLHRQLRTAVRPRQEVPAGVTSPRIS